jgi:hypothetical protein
MIMAAATFKDRHGKHLAVAYRDGEIDKIRYEDWVFDQDVVRNVWEDLEEWQTDGNTDMVAVPGLAPDNVTQDYHYLLLEELRVLAELAGADV